MKVPLAWHFDVTQHKTSEKVESPVPPFSGV